jgi:hypothetical protein
MRAAVVHSFDQPLQVEDVAKPEPGLGQVVVKIETWVSATPISTHPTAIGRSSPTRPSSLATKVWASLSRSAPGSAMSLKGIGWPFRGWGMPVGTAPRDGRPCVSASK